MNRLLVAFLLCLLTSCQYTYQKGYEPSIALNDCNRPKIIFIPVFDRCNPNLCWNVSNEFTETIREKLSLSDTLFLLNEELTFNQVLKMGHMTLDEAVNFIPSLPGRADFVVFVELVQHDIFHYEREKNREICCSEGFTANSMLQMKLRLVIVDVRFHEKTLLLDKMLVTSQRIPKEYDRWDYSETPFGTLDYLDTPICKAHYTTAIRAADYIEKAAWSFK